MPESKSDISVTAIIVTFNSSASIANCLTSLVPQINKLQGEIIVYDNDSADSTALLIKTTFPSVRIHQALKNIGFAAACNKAAQIATGRYFLFANPDLVFDSDTVTELLRVYETIPDCGILSARLRHPDGSFQPNCRQLPTMKNLLFSRGSFFRKMGLLQDKGQYNLPDFDEITAVPASSATCVLIEREFFQKLNGFDKRFFMFMEDTDLCHRIVLAGKKVYFVPKAGAVHSWGKGADIPRWRRLFYQHISIWKYFLKYYPNGFSLLALPLLLAGNFVFRIVFDRTGEKPLN